MAWRIASKSRLGAICSVMRYVPPYSSVAESRHRAGRKSMHHLLACSLGCEQSLISDAVSAHIPQMGDFQQVSISALQHFRLLFRPQPPVTTAVLASRRMRSEASEALPSLALRRRAGLPAFLVDQDAP